LSTPATARTGGRPRGPARDEVNEARARQALTRSKDAFLSSLPFSASRSRPFPQASGEPALCIEVRATHHAGSLDAGNRAHGWAPPRPARASSTRPERAKRSPAPSTHYLSSLPFSALARGGHSRRRRVSRPSALRCTQPLTPALSTPATAAPGWT